MPAFDASIITQPSDAKAVPDLINDIANLSGPVLGTWDDEARQALRDKARELMLALETPRETMIRHSWADVSCNFFIIIEQSLPIDSVASRQSSEMR